MAFSGTIDVVGNDGFALHTFNLEKFSLMLIINFWTIIPVILIWHPKLVWELSFLLICASHIQKQ